MDDKCLRNEVCVVLNYVVQEPESHQRARRENEELRCQREIKPSGCDDMEKLLKSVSESRWADDVEVDRVRVLFPGIQIDGVRFTQNPTKHIRDRKSRSYNYYH